MAQELKTFDSFGGFSVENTTIINSTKDITNANSLEIKNKNYVDANTKSYILRGNTTTTLALDNVGTQLFIPSNSISFITAHIIGVNETGAGFLSRKIESSVTCSSGGDVVEISNLITTIKDNIPSGETWTTSFFDGGAANRFSYSVSKSGGTPGETVKWVAYVQVVSIDWS